MPSPRQPTSRKVPRYTTNKIITEPQIPPYGTLSLFDSQSLMFNLEENVRDNGNAESESWILSYLDVFVLIIALLVIMLIKSPEPSSISKPNDKAVNTTSQSLMSALTSLDADYRISVISNDNQISVRLDESLLFDSSKAVIKAEGKEAIQSLIPVLKKLNRPLVIEGHTDNTPINTQLYPSNWELSAARANSVLHYISTQGISKKLLSTANYADNHPLVPNTSNANRSINRRVNLLILLQDS